MPQVPWSPRRDRAAASSTHHLPGVHQRLPPRTKFLVSGSVAALNCLCATHSASTLRNGEKRGPALRAAGVPHRRLYDCRHTFATWAIESGIELWYLARVMGTTIVQIEDTYADG
jgi:integrase